MQGIKHYAGTRRRGRQYPPDRRRGSAAKVEANDPDRAGEEAEQLKTPGCQRRGVRRPKAGVSPTLDRGPSDPRASDRRRPDLNSVPWRGPLTHVLSARLRSAALAGRSRGSSPRGADREGQRYRASCRNPNVRHLVNVGRGRASYRETSTTRPTALCSPREGRSGWRATRPTCAAGLARQRKDAFTFSACGDSCSDASGKPVVHRSRVPNAF